MFLEKTWIPLNNEVPKNITKVFEILKKNRGLIEKSNLDIKKILLNPNIAKIDNKNINKLSKDIIKIKKNGKNILIHGDYDVDGITSTAIFYEFLINIGFKKENIKTFIPNRFRHGYGLSKESLKDIFKQYSHKNTPLIVLVDCGITANKNIKKLKEKGFKVTVIDHHTLTKKKPKADYIFWNNKITASALTYLTVKLLEISIIGSTNITRSVDLASLGYVADLGDLKNPIGRAITKKGLEVFNKKTRPNIKALLKKEGLINTFELGWIIGPRINATGRISSPKKSLELLLEDKFENINKLSYEIEKINSLRRKNTNTMFQEALIGVSNKKYPGLNNNDKVIIAHSEEFHEGIIGLISSKLRQHFFKPTICIAWEGNIGKGSCRSIPGVNIVNILETQKHLLESFGGHTQAAGFTILKKNFLKFQKQILKIAKKQIPKSLLKPSIEYDMELPENLIKYDILELIKKLEPFGNGNPEPLFVTKNLSIKEIHNLGKEKKHLKIIFNEIRTPTIYFNGKEHSPTLQKGMLVKILYSLDRNYWNGNNYLQIKIKDVKKM